MVMYDVWEYVTEEYKGKKMLGSYARHAKRDYCINI